MKKKNSNKNSKKNNKVVGHIPDMHIKNNKNLTDKEKELMIDFFRDKKARDLGMDKVIDWDNADKMTYKDFIDKIHNKNKT